MHTRTRIHTHTHTHTTLPQDLNLASPYIEVALGDATHKNDNCLQIHSGIRNSSCPSS